MGKLSEMFKMFKQDAHELGNADILAKMYPSTTMHDIHHEFFFNKKTSQEAASIFDNVLKHMPDVYHLALNHSAYVEENAQNKLLLHGILFNALFNVYLKHFKKCFDNVLLSDLPEPESENMCYSLSEKRPGTNRTIINFIDYNKLPKRYRCLFVQYDADHYTLNIPNAKMVIAYNKKIKSTIEKLLLRAKMLIPVIYKTNAAFPEANFGGMLQIYDKNPKSPAFMSDSTSAKRVSDEQLIAVRELHDIFVELAKYTFVIKTDNQDKARDVYDEYMRETNQKDTVLSAYRMNKHDKSYMEESMDEETKKFEQRKKSIEENYKDNRDKLLRALSGNISVRIK